MSKVDILNLNGEKVKDRKINDKVWEIKPNDFVLHDAIVLANANEPIVFDAPDETELLLVAVPVIF